MNEKMSPFQIIVFGITIIAIVGGVIAFALQRSETKATKVPIEMWGTVPADQIALFQKLLNEQEKDSVNIIYTEYPEENFEQILLEALASRSAPDVAILSDEMLLKHENKLFSIGYQFYSQKLFKDNFIEAGEILLRENGFLGFPFVIDPLVLYWNRTILNNEGISTPPRFWDDFLTLVPRLVIRDTTATISRSAVALGEFTNIKHAKELLISLTQQAGNDIIVRDNAMGGYISVFAERLGYTLRPADTALNFFVQFSNPTKDVYSWNKSLPNSDRMFLNGDLAFYFGLASERNDIFEKNPNLNFDVAMLPQSRSSNRRSTFGKMHFLAILNQSQKISASFTTLVKITDTNSIRKWTEVSKSPSVRRDVMVDYSGSAYMDIFNNSALIARTFLDPNPNQTNQVFKNMIDTAVSGSQSVNAAVDRASQEFNNLLK